MDELFLSRLTEIILENLEDQDFRVTKLAHSAGMSLYSLNRKLRSVTNKSINQFIREVRLKKALELLRSEDLTASEVAYKVGFGSPTYFSKCFHKYYGIPPGHVKKGDTGDYEKHFLTVGNEENVLWKKILKRNISTFPGILFLTLFFLLIVFSIVKFILKSGTLDSLKSSDGKTTIAVMPFLNLTNDSTWNIWQDAIQTNLISSLSNSEELKVRQLETISGLLKGKGLTDYASITPSIASGVSQKLKTDVFIYGSVIQSGSKIRLIASLINSKTEESIKAYQIEGTPGEILHIIDSLSNAINNFFLLSKLKKVGNPVFHEPSLQKVISPEAYKCYIYGQTAFYRNDFSTAIEWYSQALKKDSGLYEAMGKLAISYYNAGDYTTGKTWCLKQQGKLDKLTIKERIWANFIHALYFKTPNERIKYMHQLKDIDDQQPMTYFNTGDGYLELLEYNKAIPEFETALDIFHKWGIKPYWGAFYYELGIAYHKTRQFKKEKKLYWQAEKDFPDDPGLMDQIAWLHLTEKDTASASRYILKWTSARKEESWSDADIESYKAHIYFMGGDIEKAEDCYRQALVLEPENHARLGALAYFLINRDRNITEGLSLIEKALKICPDNFSYLHCKGWGLYKQGRIKEAFDTLQRSWDLRRQYSIYNHDAYIHLEEVKKAMALQGL